VGVLVSVVVPLYNYEKYVVWCIESVINQTYSDWELIVVDDHSTDKSFSVARAFESDKVRVVCLKRNLGYSKAKNEGIVLSRGDLITCLDADDMLTRDSLSARVEVFLERSTVEFVHAKAIDVFGDTSVSQAYSMSSVIRRTPRIHAQTVMVRRSVYRRFGLYDEEMRSRADKEMWVRLLGARDVEPSRVEKFFLDKDVAYYRHHGKSMMDKRRANKKLQSRLTRLLARKCETRQVEGITASNTRFLTT